MDKGVIAVSSLNITSSYSRLTHSVGIRSTGGPIYERGWHLPQHVHPVEHNALGLRE